MIELYSEIWIVKYQIAPMAASIVQPMSSSVVKGISGRGVRRAGRRYMNKFF